MREVIFICRYCAYEWNDQKYFYISGSDLKCPRCNDSNIEEKEVTNKVDYYATEARPRKL